jgi:hypothetical protein
MAGRIFISYSKAEPKSAQELADFLAQQCYSVLWDTNLTSGEVFRDIIDRELNAADAVIVIWTAGSVASNWVIAEADHAARKNKLITLRTMDLEPVRIPKPYITYQTDVVDDRDAVLAALNRLTGEITYSSLARVGSEIPSEGECNKSDLTSKDWRWRRYLSYVRLLSVMSTFVVIYAVHQANRY